MPMHLPPERIIFAYVHQARIGVMVEFALDSDFAARTEEFQAFARGIAMHVAAMAPENPEALLAQPLVMDTERTVAEAVAAISQLLDERVAIVRFVRWVAGESLHPASPVPPRDPAIVLPFPRSAGKSPG